MTQYLGADPGTSGCALAILDDATKIIGVSLEISHASTAEGRRIARHQRRQIKRKRQRRDAVHKLNEKYLGIKESDLAIYPFYNRQLGLTERLSKAELAACLSHLAKHRGPQYGGFFDPNQDSRWIEAKYLDYIESDIGFLNRCDSIELSDDRQMNFPNRREVECEFEQLCSAQSAHHSELSPEVVEEYREAIFTQRPWWFSRSTIGKCPFRPSDDCLSKCDQDAQLYIQLERLNNIRVNPDGENRSLTPEERQAALDRLKNGNLTINRLNQIVGTEDHNYSPKSKSSQIQRSFFELVVSKLPTSADCPELRSQLNRILIQLSDNGKKIGPVVDRLRRVLGWHGCSPEECEQFVKHVGECTSKIPTGRIFCSRFVLLELGLLDRMKQGDNSSAALRALGLKRIYVKNPRPPILPNAVATSSLRSLDRQLGHIARECGVDWKTAKLTIESTRDIRQPKNVRQAIENKQAAREVLNSKIKSLANQHGVPFNHFKLWAQQGGVDLISQKSITIADMQKKHCQVDHIVAVAIGGDDSLENKMLVLANSNQFKSDEFLLGKLGALKCEAIAEHYKSSHVFEIDGESLKFPPDFKKAEMILSTLSSAETFWEKHHGPTTSYIYTEFASYIQSKRFQDHPTDVQSAKPLHTQMLRKHWRLESLLCGDSKREDHRHHIVDAIVVACLGVSSIRRRVEELVLGRDVVVPPPWGDIEAFRAQIKRCLDYHVVYHRVKRGARGPLHKAQMLSCYDEEHQLFAKRKELPKALTDKFATAKKKLVIDDRKKMKPGKGGFIEGDDVRQKIIETLKEHHVWGDEFNKYKVTQLVNDGKLPKRVRVVTKVDNVLVVPSKRHGKVIGKRYYEKAKGGNYRAVVWNKDGKWQISVEDMLSAAKRLRCRSQNQPEDNRDIIVVLFKNDIVQMVIPGQSCRFWRVVKMQNGKLNFVQHFNASTNPNDYITLSANQLQKLGNLTPMRSRSITVAAFDPNFSRSIEMPQYR